MGQLVRVRLNDTEVWMETETAAIGEQAPQRVSRDALAEEALKAAETLNTTIKAYCSSLVRVFETLQGTEKPQQITAEFGLKLSSDCKFYVVNAAGEASLKITVQW
jgi:Trypsin-co-occurring domain 1